MASPTNSTTFQNYANYVAEVFLGDVTGSVPSIPNPLATTSTDVTILTNPETIKAYRDSIAAQMNAQNGGGMKFVDLSERIADVIIDTSAQGAGTLEVHLIDPYWVIPNHSGIIQADTDGYLLPVDINFPTGTDCVWRLVQYRPSWRADMPSANLVLTFEDRIVSLLREISPANGGVQQGLPNQTMSQFFQMLVDGVNTLLKPTPRLRYVPLIDPADPNATVSVTQLPARVKNKLKLTGLTAQMESLLQNWGTDMLGPNFPPGDLSITEIEQILAKKSAHLTSSVPWLTPPLGYNRGTNHADPTNYAK